MSFLEKQRTKETYFLKIQYRSQAYKKAVSISIRHFEDFCKTINQEEVIKGINGLPHEQKESAIFDVLQDFVNYLASKNMSHNTIKSYFVELKPYLSYLTNYKIHREDVEENINFPRKIKIRYYGLTLQNIRDLLENSSKHRKMIYLVLISSGIRIQELCKLRKRDFDTSGLRWKIKLPASYTKSRQERITFISKEAQKLLQPLLESKKFDDLVFVTNPNSPNAVIAEDEYFAKIRSKSGLIEKTETGRHRVIIHSFRSFFISRCENVNSGLGHALSGHGRYMKVYDRFSDQELMEFYLKVEPDLLIFDNPNEKETNERISDLERKLQKAFKEIRFLRAGIKPK